MLQLSVYTFLLPGQTACPAVPGRPLICVNSASVCPSACLEGFKVCGLKRVEGRLVIGADGLPVPNCVRIQDAGSALCDQPNIRPLPADITGGSGAGGWNSTRLNGTTDDGRSVGSIAEIGSDTFSDGPIFFAGNGSGDTTSVVKVSVIVVRCSCNASQHFAVCHCCSCRLGSSVRFPSSHHTQMNVLHPV